MARKTPSTIDLFGERLVCELHESGGWAVAFVTDWTESAWLCGQHLKTQQLRQIALGETVHGFLRSQREAKRAG